MHQKQDRSTEHDQLEKFEQAARELGVELDEEKLKEALRKIASEKKQQKND